MCCYLAFYRVTSPTCPPIKKKYIQMLFFNSNKLLLLPVIIEGFFSLHCTVECGSQSTNCSGSQPSVMSQRALTPATPACSVFLSTSPPKSRNFNKALVLDGSLCVKSTRSGRARPGSPAPSPAVQKCARDESKWELHAGFHSECTLAWTVVCLPMQPCD